MRRTADPMARAAGGGATAHADLPGLFDPPSSDAPAPLPRKRTRRTTTATRDRRPTVVPSRDTDTSREAARRMAKGRAQTDEQAILDLLRARGCHGATREELGLQLTDRDGLSTLHAIARISSAGARLRKLTQDGLVRDGGQRRPTIGGSPAIVWVLVGERDGQGAHDQVTGH